MSGDVSQDQTAGARLYQKKRGRQLRPQSGTDGLSTGSSNGSVRLKLNKLNDYEADDAKMVTVFGVANEETPSSMKLNPLYDKNGTIEVTPEEANKVRKATMSAKNYQPKNRPKSSDFSPRPVSSSAAPTSETEEVLEPPKIAYSKNFRFKHSQKAKQNNGNISSDKNGSVKSFGRVMPSRIHKLWLLLFKKSFTLEIFILPILLFLLGLVSIINIYFR
ncbi:uncharacterized protein LOC117120279 [Anneissia japonica]|uniref:uncharacterized protein LOC117120279 n=1 Tax=Anneissia japonica TaxID=1529436 RepID=UPI0014259F65|nr:uncharacterized protein LOC117120279 [Anneissia japonica]